MKTNFEDLKRLEKITVPVNDWNIMLSDNPVQNILEDLEELKMYNHINLFNNIDDIIKWLKTVPNIKSGNTYIRNVQIIDSILEARYNPSHLNISEIPACYGIRSKVTEIIFLSKQEKKGYQIKMEL